jgi:hypothetical protein
MKLANNSLLRWSVCPYLGVIAGVKCKREPNKNKLPQITHTLCNFVLYNGGECVREGNCITAEIIRE